MDPPALNVVPNGWTCVGKDEASVAAVWDNVPSSYRCLTKKYDTDYVKPDSWILENWFQDAPKVGGLERVSGVDVQKARRMAVVVAGETKDGKQRKRVYSFLKSKMS